MPLNQTSGNATADSFGGGVAAVPNYIEDVFSTYLWDGNATARNIVNGIDLATKGGMVWAKYRNATASNRLYDTARGATKQIFSDLTNAEQTAAQSLTSFNTDGFSLGTGQPNENTATVVGWTFRKQPKFFDVVTYTGNGTATNNISHNLGSVPGFIVVKCTSAAGYRWVCAASDNSGNYLYLTLNTTFASDASTVKSNIANSTTFNPGYMGVYFDGGANVSGETYVAYLFASNAGGFGLTGTDNVISCGSFTADGSGNATVNLGYEPQYLLWKRTDASQNWFVADTMRGFAYSGDQVLRPNLSDSEFAASWGQPTATGFSLANQSAGGTFIYIAIRRGPMKVPTDATKVFQPVARAGTGTTTTVTTSLSPVDMSWIAERSGAFGTGPSDFDRLRGSNKRLVTSSTAAETTTTDTLTGFDVQTGYTLGADSGGYAVNYSGFNYINWNFKRAPSFFDEVCYDGTGATATTQTHNLGATPEFMIIKSRNTGSTSWVCYHKGVNGGVNPQNYYMLLQSDQAQTALTAMFNDTAPTSSVFTVGPQGSVGASGRTYVAYLFATCAGVSKVFSFTGNGTTQTINCGFAGGARFVLLKASSATGGWYVYDTARGMTVLTDPYLQLNSTAAETATLGSVTTVTTGFAVNEAITTGVNTNGVTYIGLAIA